MISAALLLVVGVSLTSASLFGDDDKILLGKDTSALTFYKGRYTAGRRSAGIPQLTCVGGTASSYKYEDYRPDVVQCQMVGGDAWDPQWRCEADLEADVKFGAVEVVCEGYNSPDDKYVLRGSCGLEYQLQLTAAGRERDSIRYEENNNDYHFNQDRQDYHQRSEYYNGTQRDSSFSLKNIAIIACIVAIVYLMAQILSPSGPSATSSGGGSGGGGGGYPSSGYGGGYPSGGYGGGGNGGYGPGPDQCNNAYPNTNNFFGGGRRGGGNFWTGAAAGGMLGYLFGRPRRGYNNYGGYNRGYNTGYNSGYNRGYSNGPTQRTYTRSQSNSHRPSTTTRSATRSAPRTAAGFGGTRRR